MSTILVPSGPDLQINTDNGGGNGVAGAQQFPQTSALTDGRFAVVYQSPSFGNASDNDIIARFVNSDGSLSTNVVLTAAGQQTTPAVAGRSGGGFGVVFTNERHADGTVDPNGTNITYRAVSAAGTPAAPFAIADFNGGIGQDALQAPAIATLQSGRQIVVFERVVSSTDSDVFLNVVNAAGTATEFSAAAPLAVASANRNEIQPAIAANGENALIVYTEGRPDQPSIGSFLFIRVLDGATNTLGPTLQGVSGAFGGDHLFNPSVIALDGNRYAVVFQHTFGGVFSAIYDPAVTGTDGAALSQIHSVTGSGSNPSLARSADGGFVVSWTESNGTDLDVRARAFTVAGEPVGGFGFGAPLTLGTLTDADQNFSFVATNADHAFFAWQDGGVRPGDGTPTGVHGMMFQMFKVSAHSDFNGDAVDDLLWRRSDGQVAEWQMKDGQITANTNLANVASSYQLQDSGDLNGDAFADVLWRHDSGQVVLWTMRNGMISQQQAIATIGGDWHNEGIGDFGGDGRADVLWRHDSGQVALWSMNGGTIVNNQSVANISFDWHNQGLGDFNGDGHSDVLWRHSNGQVVMWQMNGATIASNTAVANLGLDWHVLGVGDFNGDGHSDVLLRHNSGQVVEWQMNGATIVNNQAVANIDATWHLVDIGDHSGDGRSDVIWRNDSGQTVIWEMNGTTITDNHTVGTIAFDYAPLTHHYDLI